MKNFICLHGLSGRLQSVMVSVEIRYENGMMVPVVWRRLDLVGGRS
jgi:hypothetical protein